MIPVPRGISDGLQIADETGTLCRSSKFTLPFRQIVLRQEPGASMRTSLRITVDANPAQVVMTAPSDS